MSKLIDAEKLDFVSYQGIPNGYKNSFDSGILYAMNLIDDQPTIDAVLVVRCKDCKWCNKEYYGEQETEWVWYCPNVEQMVGDNWFCADGERVTE